MLSRVVLLSCVSFRTKKKRRVPSNQLRGIVKVLLALAKLAAYDTENAHGNVSGAVSGRATAYGSVFLHWHMVYIIIKPLAGLPGPSLHALAKLTGWLAIAGPDPEEIFLILPGIHELPMQTLEEWCSLHEFTIVASSNDADMGEGDTPASCWRIPTIVFDTFERRARPAVERESTVIDHRTFQRGDLTAAFLLSEEIAAFARLRPGGLHMYWLRDQPPNTLAHFLWRRSIGGGPIER